MWRTCFSCPVVFIAAPVQGKALDVASQSVASRGGLRRRGRRLGCRAQRCQLSAPFRGLAGAPDASTFTLCMSTAVLTVCANERWLWGLQKTLGFEVGCQPCAAHLERAS